MLSKAELRKEFAKDWQKHYRTDFLIKQGFERKTCIKCGKGFWTLDAERKVCPDQPCSFYEFLGNPPTKKKMDYIETWKAIEKFFVKNKHTSLRRYPVVCRWYPLYFTAAGIIDFYRVENGNVVFDFPANPVILPQWCLRFNDIPNVGVTGKHYSCFVMVQQSSIYDKSRGSYWKDRCLELDFNLLKDIFKIPEKDIVFLEDLWMGPGALGPSMEYFVKGLEIGNAVFTEFLVLPDGSIKPMQKPVIDMGAGLERFAWITQGTPTSYDVTFKPIVDYLKKQTAVDYDKDFFLRYSKMAGLLNFDEVPDVEKAREQIAKQLGTTADVLKKKILPLEAIYAIADHTSALTFAISDGALPSNVGGGYNLRVILRRALAFLNEFGWNIDLAKICELHAQHLKRLAPELKEHIPEIQRILDVETKRFNATRERARIVVESLVKKNEKPSEDKLTQLYESEGIAPELIKESFEKKGQTIDVPADFYVKLTAKHMEEKEIEEKIIDVTNLPQTRLLFYANEKQIDFKAKVLKIIDGKYVVLDQTCFYGKSGGQEHDTGTLDRSKVLEVKKQTNVIVHIVDKPTFKVGDIVKGKIDWNRRWQLMQHHTATHIINVAARKVLGEHVWQHSAYKAIDHARLDVTHYEALSDEQAEQIEKLANQIVSKGLAVKKTVMPRAKAEAKYGFRLYQGGAAPSKDLRIVSIEGVDVEACGGTHLSNTKDIQLINILRTKRIQDGVVRIEFTAGGTALNELKEKERLLKETAKLLKVKETEVPKAVDDLFKRWKAKRKELKEMRK